MKRISEINLNTPEFFDDRFEFDMKRYNNLKPIDLNRFFLITKDFNGGKFLDLGVLNCPFVLELRKKFPNAEYWVLDFSSKAIEFWRKNFPNIQSVLADSRFTPFRDEYFDFILVSEILEHMDNVEAQIKEIFRILKIGGTFAFSTPLEEGTKNKKVAPEHIWSFSELDMKHLFSDYGELELTSYGESFPHMMGSCKKIGNKYAI